MWITWYTRGMDAKDLLIEKQAAEIKALKETIKQMREQNAILQERIARLEKNSNNSSKPPSSDIVKPKRTVLKVSRKKRKRGGQPGHKKYSRKSFSTQEIDHAFDYELPDKDAESYFRFLTEPEVEPTNNGTEREIRHTVIG